MISVLCSNYNSSRWIDRYCSYINAQLLNTFEVVFVDANSTDDSLQKIKDFNFRDGIEVAIIELKDRVTVYEAWNTAIEASTYDYVINYNTDDKLFNSALYTLAAYLQLCPHIDVLYSNCFIASDYSHHNIVSFYSWQDANDIQNLLKGCCCGPFPLLKKETVIKCGMFDPSFTISGDYEMWCRMNSKGAKFKKIDEFLGVYYQNPEGVSTSPDAERHSQHVQQDNIIRTLYS
tara:strand:+ start:48 stop:746 length:699 start_codon:yes stop_codon:yes gene_type:complete